MTPKKSPKEQLPNLDTIQSEFGKRGYICNRQIATAVYLSTQLDKPILVEGPPGVGKTELARTLSEVIVAVARAYAVL